MRQSCLFANALVWLACVFATHPAYGFAGYLSPPRVEINAKAGDVLREVMIVGNEDAAPATFDVQSADWSLDALGVPTFQIETLAPGSCRDWLKLERRQLNLAARSERRFRFEIHVPPTAQPGLCRFAILVSSAAPASTVELPNLRLPVQGRLALIAYVMVGDIKPALALVKVSHELFQGKSTPVLVIRNTGMAQGRLEGSLQGVDARGQALEFTVANSVILPGEERTIPLWVNELAGKPLEYSRPLTLKGSLDWSGGKITFNHEIK